MNRKSHSTDSGSVTSKVLRRTAATVAGLAMVIGGFMAASPARADVEDLEVSTASGTTADISVSNCNANSSGVTYSVEDLSGNAVAPEVPVTSWNQENDFSFTVSGLNPGEYIVNVFCLGYSGREDQTGSAPFTITDAIPLELTVSPSTWKTGDKVTLSATGMAPGEKGTFGFGDIDGHQPIAEWSATADASGNASVTVAWPGTDGTQALNPGQYQVWIYAPSEAGPYVVIVSLGADNQWTFGKNPGPTGGGGSLPSTGN